MPSYAPNKLKRAVFFLERMKKSIDNSEAFESYFYAFLSFARSVTFLMETETNHTTLQSWSKQTYETLTKDTNFKLVMDARDITIHGGVNDTDKFMTITVYHRQIQGFSQTRVDGTNVVMEEREDSRLTNNPPLQEIANKWYFTDSFGDDIITRAERVIAQLTQLLAEYRDKRLTLGLD